MVELGTRRTYRKGACRKLSACRLRASHFYPDPLDVPSRYGPPDMRINDLATDSVDIVKWDDLDDGISADDISLKGLVKFFMKKPIDYLFQKIKARKLKTFYTMAEKSVRIPDRADKLARLFGISWDSEYHTAMKYAAAPVDYVVIVNEKTSDILNSE